MIRGFGSGQPPLSSGPTSVASLTSAGSQILVHKVPEGEARKENKSGLGGR